MKRLSEMSFGLRVVLVVIFIWSAAVFPVTYIIITESPDLLSGLVSLVGGLSTWLIPSALLWFLAGGYRLSS